MNAELISRLAAECESKGRSFRSVRREFGNDVYYAVRNECVRRGRGSFLASGVVCDDGSALLSIDDEQEGISFSDACNSWAGSDNAPGTLTWEEWEASTGLDYEGIQQLADFGEVEIAAEVPHLVGRENLTEEEVEELYEAADRLWVARIEAYEGD